MKTVKYSLLLLLFVAMVPTQTSAVPSKLLGNALYGATLVGSTASFLVWLPNTQKSIRANGFLGAVATTHVIRTAIDILGIAAASYGLYQTNTSDAKPINKEEAYMRFIFANN